MKTLMLLTWLTGTGADAASTHYALTRGAHEVVMTQNPYINDALIGAQMAGGALLLSRLYKTHPKTAIVVGLAAGAFRAGIAYHNVLTVR